MDSAPCERTSSGMDETEPLTQRSQMRVGTLLKDKWRLDKLIGVGGMAAVYAATHRNSKRVAVKMLHAELSIDEHVRQRFLREGYVANRVGHRGAVAVDDDDIAEDGAAFLVMELLEGETLETRMLRKGGRLGAAEVLSLMDQVLDTLAAAHEKGIVHRDLKPENLFLTRDGVVKVLDFGIARLQESAGRRSATQAGSLMGTPSFMAPEQARARWDDVDGRTDLWAIGATMFALLTGRFVHEAETVNEVLVLAVTERARSLLVVAPDAHPAVMAVVDKALAYERENRYQTATEMRNALRAAHAAIEGHDQMAPLSVPQVPSERGAALPVSPSKAKPATLTTGRGVSASVAEARTNVSLVATTAASARSSLRPFVAPALAATLLLSVAAVGFFGRRTAPPASSSPRPAALAAARSETLEPAAPRAETKPSSGAPPAVLVAAKPPLASTPPAVAAVTPKVASLAGAATTKRAAPHGALPTRPVAIAGSTKPRPTTASGDPFARRY